jgi:excisionase family DNA binding protein
MAHFGFDLGVSAVDLGPRRTTSVTGVHLWCMKTTVEDLADELHVSVQTIYDLRTQGRGPVGFRVGRCLRLRRSEIDAWLARLEEEDAQRQGRGA